jgi:uncharacterized protein (DUF885 family)
MPAQPSPTRRPDLWLGLVLALALAPVGHAGAAAADADAGEALHSMFDARWEQLMRTYPEWASQTGDQRYGDRLRDASAAALAAEFDANREALAQARRIARDRLSAQDRMSLDLFVFNEQEHLSLEPFLGFRSMTLGARGGLHSEFVQLLQSAPVDTEAQARQLLARLQALPKRMDQELAQLRQSQALGWVPPRQVLQRVLAQIDEPLGAPLAQGPYFEAFTRLGQGISAAEQDRLREQARATIERDVLPALRQLRDFVAQEYLPAAPDDGALLRYPRGSEIYAVLVREHTTTALSPLQIHAIGLRELARLRGAMDTIVESAGFGSDFAAYVKHLNSDPKYFHTSPEALLAAYRDIAKRIDPELPKLFAELPRMPYGVRAMPAHYDKDTAEYYDSPALDGSRPGWFNANAKAFAERPTWAMETLVAHEAVPGHHLQVARAVELGDLPKFRRSADFTAYQEGWALYAETLGFELGLYKDAASRFGHLQWQAFRAGRLVVDTGIHALGWSRQQAIDFLVERTGVDLDFATSEVDRYTSWPAQALAYMIGELKIIELRDRAKARLGPRFDIRRFHLAVLDQGPLPLPLLEQAIDEWIAAQAAASARPPS